MRADYLVLDWTVKTLIYIGGVTSTILGSVVSSKVRVYHDARNSHRDELKNKVLEPLRESLSSYYSNPRFNIVYQTLKYNPEALSGEFPTSSAPAVTLERLGEPAIVDEALSEDARMHHYQSLMVSWDVFENVWNEEAKRHREFIESIGMEILSASSLPAFPTAFSSPYVMHWYLGNFVYSRLVLDAVVRLEIGSQQDAYILTDSHVTTAKGTEAAMKNLIQWVDGEMAARREQAKALREGLQSLGKSRTELLHALSLAIAEKKLRRGCSLVTFF